jgi:hypothetical protein
LVAVTGIETGEVASIVVPVGRKVVAFMAGIVPSVV